MVTPGDPAVFMPEVEGLGLQTGRVTRGAGVVLRFAVNQENP